MQYMNRAEIRDEVRRLIGITPPIDPQPGTNLPVPGALEGDLPPGLPDPSNEVINSAVERVVSTMNLSLGFHIDDPIILAVTAAPSTSLGVQWIDLSAVLPFSGAINTVLSAQFLPSSSTIPILLKAASRASLDRNGDDYALQPAGVPVAYLMQGYSIGLSPASLSDGSLYLTCGTGMLAPWDDASTVEQMPADWQPTLLDGVVVDVLQRTAEDAEKQAKMAVFAPRFARGMELLARNVLLRNTADQPRLVIDSDRRGYGTTRLRR